jgi:hypothetical protein
MAVTRKKQQRTKKNSNEAPKKRGRRGHLEGHGEAEMPPGEARELPLDQQPCLVEAAGKSERVETFDLAFRLAVSAAYATPREPVRITVSGEPTMVLRALPDGGLQVTGGDGP